ncbi:MAG: RidA family protein [Alphaproteobacteria bacterium]|nr:RidA family protein [Alphaproteobacteria bacterium]
MGQHNHHHGEVLAYEAVHGTGGAVVGLTPTGEARGDKEFDEDDVEVWHGHREVLDPVSDEDEEDVPTPPAPRAPEPAPTRSASVTTATAAAPVGAYPHARRVDDLLYLSGVGPRQPGTDAIPGGPIRDAAGAPLPYDVAAQTRACIGNVRAVLEAAGASLADVVDVTAFLVDMDRDFAAYNAVYAELLGPVGPTRTTLAVRALPTPIAVELKVIAHVPLGRDAPRST